MDHSAEVYRQEWGYVAGLSCIALTSETETACLLTISDGKRDPASIGRDYGATRLAGKQTTQFAS